MKHYDPPKPRLCHLFLAFLAFVVFQLILVVGTIELSYRAGYADGHQWCPPQ